MAYSAEKMLEELKDKVSSEKANEIKEFAAELKELLNAKEKDLQKIKSKSEELSKKMQEASAELYKHAQQGSAGQKHGRQNKNNDAEQGNDENIVDADFEAKDEK